MVKPSAFARLKQEEAPPAPSISTVIAPAAGRGERGRQQASRLGRKTVIFYDLPEAVRALKQVALDQDRTLQDLMHEALDDLLVKYGKHAFGKR